MPVSSSESAPRCVVYTCLFGFSEAFNDFAYERDDRIDYICFTDDPDLRSDNWTMNVRSPGLLDAARASKQIKALPHRFLPQYDWSLYIDNTVRLKCPPRELFDRFLAKSRSPFMCFRHHCRDCVYDEAAAVIESAMDDPVRVQRQMSFYRDLGYPANNGLAKGAFILRRHNSRVLTPVMERWHQQVLLHSKRDQLSLNVVAWFDDFEISYLDEKFIDFELLDWPVVKDGIRVPRDFDDVRYRELNPDVTINSRKHYLLTGAAEQRAYR